MCKCTPNMRTPFCGKPGCEWPDQKVVELTPVVEMKTDRRDHRANRIEALLKEVERLRARIERAAASTTDPVAARDLRDALTQQSEDR